MSFGPADARYQGLLGATTIALYVLCKELSRNTAEHLPAQLEGLVGRLGRLGIHKGPLLGRAAERQMMHGSRSSEPTGCFLKARQAKERWLQTKQTCVSSAARSFITHKCRRSL